MSTQTNTYVILGILYPRYLLPEEVREAEDDLMDDAFRKPRPYEKLTILSDGMDGKYTIIGHVLARSDCDQGLDKPITLPELTPQDEARLDKILKRFPPPAGTKVRRGWHVLTHYR